MALNVGSRLGLYSVTALIGDGGMGEVTQPQPVLPIKFEDQVVRAIQIFPEKLHAAAMKGRYAGGRQSVQGEPRVAALWADVDAIFTVSHVVSQLVAEKMTDGDLNLLP